MYYIQWFDLFKIHIYIYIYFAEHSKSAPIHLPHFLKKQILDISSYQCTLISSASPLLSSKSSQLGGEDEKDSVMHWTNRWGPCHTSHELRLRMCYQPPGWCPQPAVPASNHLPFCMKAPQRGNLSLMVHLQLSYPKQCIPWDPDYWQNRSLEEESLLNLTWSKRCLEGVLEWRRAWGATSYSSTRAHLSRQVEELLSRKSWKASDWY